MPKRRILLVEDEPDIIKTVGKRLEISGYEVLVAMDGEQGLEKAKLGQVDIIILDLMLPKMSGYDVCKTLKMDTKYKHIPIIIFTGKGQDMDERVCRELGANAYIDKPRSGTALIEQIEALLGSVMPPKDSTTS